MSSLLALAKDLEQQSKAQQQSTGEMLKAAFSEHEQSVCGTERKREENQRRHQRPRAGYDRGDAVEPAERAAYGRPDVADHHPVSVLLIATSGSILWWQGSRSPGITRLSGRRSGRRPCCRRRTTACSCRLGRRNCPASVNPKAELTGRKGNWMVLERK